MHMDGIAYYCRLLSSKVYILIQQIITNISSNFCVVFLSLNASGGVVCQIDREYPHFDYQSLIKKKSVTTV